MPKDSLALTIELFNKKISKLEEMLISHKENMKGVMSEMRSEMKEMMMEMKHEMPNLNSAFEMVKGKDGMNGEHGKDSEVPGPQGDKGDKGDPGKDGKNGVDGLNGLDGKDGRDGVDGKDGKDGSPDTAEQVRNKLETLKDDERLDKDAIKGLKELLEEITRVASTKVVGGGGRRLQPVKFSFVGDGSTTSFALATNPYDEALIFAHSEGQWLQPGTHFNLVGKNLVTTFTPESGERIRGTFLKF